VARIRGGSSPARVGTCVAGIYEDLLLRERESVACADAAAAGRARRGLGVFRRSRHLLDALEAGEPVTLPAEACVQVPEHMRPGGRAGVRWWRVTPDDAVKQANSPVVDRPAAGTRRAVEPILSPLTGVAR
jgi:hypothetical protein